MAYPNPYQPYQPSYYQPNLSQTQSNMNSNLIWVQGEAGARAYLVAPNTTVPLWDSEKKTIYLKSADASGMPSIKYIDYTIREEGKTVNEVIPNKSYATADDIECIYEELDELKKKIDSINNKRYTSKKREVTHNEHESYANAKSN